jgi:hypothetical protein
MKRIGLVVACMIATLTTSAARAQDTSSANALVAGAKSLSFAVPAGGNRYASGAAGIWYMLSDDMNLGVNVGLGIDRTDTGTDTNTAWDILLAPALRYYMAKGVVNPYFLGQVNLRFHDDGGADNDPELGIAGGIGAEWFPVRNFSIGGEAGVGIDIIRSGAGEPIRLGTFTSALVANIYWE